MKKTRLITILLMVVMLCSLAVAYAKDDDPVHEAILNVEEVDFPAGWDTRRHDTLKSGQVTFPKSPMTGNEIISVWNSTGFTQATGVDRELSPLMGIRWTWSGTTVNYDDMIK